MVNYFTHCVLNFTEKYNVQYIIDNRKKRVITIISGKSRKEKTWKAKNSNIFVPTRIRN